LIALKCGKDEKFLEITWVILKNPL